jgi:hypothetical protein
VILDRLIGKFPIRVVIFKKYGNVLKPVMDRARYERRRIKTQDGIIESNYLVLKNEKVKIPAPPLNFYYDIDDTRYIYLLQVDRFTYYPISFDGNKIRVKVKAYLTDEQGNIIKDEKGNPKFEYVEVPIFDSKIVLDNGNVVEIPTMITHKTYDKEHWLSNEIESAFRLYRSKSFWERYGNYIILGMVGIFMVMVLYIGIGKYAELTQTLVDGLKEVSQSMNVVADKLVQVVRETSGQPMANTTKPPY